MEVKFTNTFNKSLKRLIWHQHWLYRTYSTFRYDIPLFIKNIWRFRRELYQHQWWDYHFNLRLLYRSLSITYKGMKEKGIEVSETREPKLKAMERVLELLKNKLDDNYIERTEDKFGKLPDTDWGFEKCEDGLYRLVDDESEEEKSHRRNIYKTAQFLEDEEWKELWDLIKGTKNSRNLNKYDGSDMRGWWD